MSGIFNQGDTVVLDEGHYPDGLRVTQSDGYSYMTIHPGDVCLVTREGSEKMMVRHNGNSAWVFQHLFVRANRHGEVGKEDRKLGRKPDDAELDILDPRLEWFWDDLSKYAEQSGYCPQFDRALKDLGLPPRKKNFTARGTLGSIAITGQVMARSQEEADKLFTTQIVVSMREAASALDSEDLGGGVTRD